MARISQPNSRKCPHFSTELVHLLEGQCQETNSVVDFGPEADGGTDLPDRALSTSSPSPWIEEEKTCRMEKLLHPPDP